MELLTFDSCCVNSFIYRKKDFLECICSEVGIVVALQVLKICRSCIQSMQGLHTITVTCIPYKTKKKNCFTCCKIYSYYQSLNKESCMNELTDFAACQHIQSSTLTHYPE